MSVEDVSPGTHFKDEPSGPLTSEERMWGMFCHLSVLLAYFAAALTFIGPLVCWLIKKDSSRFVDYHGKESLNFQINVLIYNVICGALVPCFGIGLAAFVVVQVYNIVCVIVAGIKANGGELFRYPLVFRLIK
jgi:uncharacterized Tic20 family protein